MAVRRNRPLIIFLSLLALVIVLAGTTLYFYRKAAHTTPTDTQAETKALVEEVGKVMYLPENETPTIATVSDPSKLSNQAFFQDAKKGDKVLIYTNAKKAVLYDPVAKKIVNVSIITPGTNPSGTTPEIPTEKP